MLRLTLTNALQYDQKFLDKVRVKCYGGNGGNGCLSYWRENYGFKIADGGNGGRGGDVSFQASGRLSNLHELRRAHFKGNNGKHGKGQKRGGSDAKDIMYNVPVGTEVFKIKKSEDPDDPDCVVEQLSKVADLDEEGQSFLVAKGGRGGVGNFQDKRLQVMEKGGEGEFNEYELRLKLIADVGFIGFPNAGKSTLLSALTRAFPKIAHYPFTTLRPYIGQVKFVDSTEIVLADLPGIIEGAHENRGLGHDFLAHAERTKMLLYVIDGTVVEDGRTPLKDLEVLHRELQQYKGGMLLDRPAVIAINKSDRKYTNFSQRLKSLQSRVDAPIIPISAKEGTNLELLLETIREKISVDS